MVLNLSSFIIFLFVISLIAINSTIQVRAFASAETEIDSNSETLNYKMQRPSFPEHWGPPRKCTVLCCYSDDHIDCKDNKKNIYIE